MSWHFLASLFGHLFWLGARVFLAKLTAPLGVAVVKGSEKRTSKGRQGTRSKRTRFQLEELHKFSRMKNEEVEAEANPREMFTLSGG